MPLKYFKYFHFFPCSKCIYQCLSSHSNCPHYSASQLQGKPPQATCLHSKSPEPLDCSKKAFLHLTMSANPPPMGVIMDCQLRTCNGEKETIGTRAYIIHSQKFVLPTHFFKYTSLKFPFSVRKVLKALKLKCY